MLAAPTLGAAIERAIATIGFHSKGDELSIAVVNGQARLSYASAAKGKVGYQHVACGAAGVIVSLCRSFLPADWRPRRIELDIPRPRRAGIFEDAFDCPVVFDAAEVAVCLDTSRLHEESLRHNARSVVTVEDLARVRVECRTLNALRDIIAEQICRRSSRGGFRSIAPRGRSIRVSGPCSVN